METGHLLPNGDILVKPIGVIRTSVVQQQFGGFQELQSRVELQPQFADFLPGLEEYSHLKVIYWLTEVKETHGPHRPQGNEDAPVVGMFACR